MNDIVAMTAVDLSNAIHAGTLSSVEVMTAYLDHIERFNPAVNAIVSLRDRTVLLAEAGEKDGDLAAGHDAGWMHGFPAAVKDLDPVKGIRWTQGSRIFAHRIAEADSLQVRRMRAAGAIFIGKTNTPEFGLGSQTFNHVFGTTRNPYDLARTAGGSSGGAAAALATRMLPVADGSDHAGSLRNPAAFNNVFGLRNSFGRIPAELDDVFAASLGVPGPMARTVEDLAMLLSIQAGPDPRAPLSILESPKQFATFARGPMPSLKGKRIAWMGERVDIPYEPGVLAIWRGALAVFETLGCIVEDAAPDFSIDKVWEAWLVLRAWTVSRNLGPLAERPETRALMKTEALWEVDNGRALTLDGISAALATRSAWYQAVRGFFDRYDAIVLPSAQVFPFAADLPWPTSIAGVEMDTYHRWMSVVIPGTMSGCPVIGVPAGFNREGLPIGFQMICRMARELDCLAFARAFDAEVGWSRTLPNVLTGAVRPLISLA